MVAWLPVVEVFHFGLPEPGLCLDTQEHLTLGLNGALTRDRGWLLCVREVKASKEPTETREPTKHKAPPTSDEGTGWKKPR